VEGDNYMLPQQVAKVLLKVASAVQNEESASETDAMYRDCDCAYLLPQLRSLDEDASDTPSSPPFSASSLPALASLFERRSAHLLLSLGRDIEERTTTGAPLDEAWNQCLLLIAKVSKAHATAILLRNFAAVVTENEGAHYEAMKDLAFLFALWLVEENSGEFLEAGLVRAEDMPAVRAGVLELLKKIRPNAVGFVDAFDFPDFRLKSALGRYDGNVYEAIIGEAAKDTMNAKQVWEPVVAGVAATASRL
jgi:hypothetical protein